MLEKLLDATAMVNMLFANTHTRCLPKLDHADTAELVLVSSEISAHLLCDVVGLALLAHAWQALWLALDAVAVVTARLQFVAVLDLWLTRLNHLALK